MNRHSRVNIVALSISLFFFSCYSNTKTDCDLCFSTSLKNNDDTFVVEMVFDSNIDKQLVLPGEAFIVGCPFYQEDQVFFEDTKPDINQLNYTQIVLENENGGFRIFSSQFFALEVETKLRMPNCAFIGEKRLNLKVDEKTSLEFNVWTLNDLKVDDSDTKVRLHLYYKDVISREGTVISSSNWIRIHE